MMKTKFDFSGKKVLVTGAGRGIGRGIAIALSQAGCKVYALSKTKSSLDSLAAEYKNVVPITQDLANWDETRKVLEEIEPLDGLVNNAGDAGNYAPAVDVSIEDLNRKININLLSAINCTQVVAKKMIKTKTGGSIVNMSSLVSLKACPVGLPYTLAKAGMDISTKQFALELGSHNIRVNSVNPTAVLTDMSKSLIDSGIPVDKLVLERTPMPRLPEVGDIVGPVLYLLSDLSAMVSGTNHVIDGGLLCNVTTKTG